ncbi:MAG TPA: phosphate ABC transporter substrate-binding protein PstS [Acidimicrobiales bacterium]|nr:phosphate ABC transporter substrate-binding protein PstS [Acidimicrobiales bacterium]
MRFFRSLWVWFTAAFTVAVVATGVILVAPASPGGADTSYVPISGEGSTWSENALDQWIADVQQDGMRINYDGNGSTQGRQAFIAGTTDFAASDIPFQTNPGDGSAPETPVPNSYAYMPITAGGTVFMYNLKIDGNQVTNLRLSGENIAKIFSGEITNWDDPAIAADNPALKLPNEPIVPVVRSDGAGSSFELSEWMISQYPSVWNSFCHAAGRAPACGATSFWPTVSGMIAQSGDLGVAGYVAQSYAAGSIGYVEYSYALNAHFPVVNMLNSAGYYTEPTPENVAVSLLQAQINMDQNNEAVYLTENLSNVYTDPDPRTYPLSSYSYLILPTTLQGQFSLAKGKTLGAFSYYAMCQGQQESAGLGYSPMPINLVEASFQQITKIPGVNVQAINIQSCNNPTFTPSGQNLLALEAPYPPACDKQGPTQCTNGTGGASNVSTPVSGSQSAGVTIPGGVNPTSGATGGGGTASSSGGGSGGTVVGASGVKRRAQGDQALEQILNSAAFPEPATVPGHRGWGLNQLLVALVTLAVVGVVVVPGLIARRAKRRER